jgi:hypothetical protein
LNEQDRESVAEDIQQKEGKGGIEQADLEEQETNNGIF